MGIGAKRYRSRRVVAWLLMGQTFWRIDGLELMGGFGLISSIVGGMSDTVIRLGRSRCRPTTASEACDWFSGRSDGLLFRRKSSWIAGPNDPFQRPP